MQFFKSNLLCHFKNYFDGFDQCAPPTPGELGAMNRSTESLGKLLGKYLCGTVYMPWFMKQGGMLCDMDKRDTDLQCAGLTMNVEP